MLGAEAAMWHSEHCAKTQEAAHTNVGAHCLQCSVSMAACGLNACSTADMDSRRSGSAWGDCLAANRSQQEDATSACLAARAMAGRVRAGVATRQSGIGGQARRQQVFAPVRLAMLESVVSWRIVCMWLGSVARAQPV